MALLASFLLLPSSTPKFPSKLVLHQPWELQRHRSFPLGIRHGTLSKCGLKVSMSQFGGPESDEVKMQMGFVKEKLQKAIPDSVKELEWEKATNLVLKRLVYLGQKALKWSIVVLFILSSLSDVVFSMSRNQELIIPFGLLVGCLVADFLKETSQQVFPSSQGRGLNSKLVGIGFFFIFVKFISMYFGIRGKVFLLHVANGGFMQVLWLGKSLQSGTDEDNQVKSFSEQDSSLGVDAKN